MSRDNQQPQESVEDIVGKYNEIRRATQKWVDKRDHDRCWYSPKIFRKIAEILEIKPTGPIKLTPRPE